MLSAFLLAKGMLYSYNCWGADFNHRVARFNHWGADINCGGACIHRLSLEADGLNFA